MTGDQSIRVLVVEDEQVAGEANAVYLQRLGYQVVGLARSGREALRLLAQQPADLVLLDFNLPDGHGLALLRAIRAAGHDCDVIAVTAARDLEMVKQAVAHGVVSYLIKPFTFPGFRAKLDQYAAYRAQLQAQAGTLAQSDVDSVLALLRPTGQGEDLPKGLTATTLAIVTQAVREAPEGLSASEVAERIGTSRVTARRYLEHLAEARAVTRESRYGGAGRPEVQYVWRR